MEWNALNLSLKLAFWTCAILLPLAVIVGRWLAWNHFRGKAVVEALVAVPLVLPPTVLGYYLILSFGSTTTIGRFYETLTGHGLVFTFDGLLLASIIFNLPFAVQPMQRAFEAVPMNVREAAWCCGMSHWQTFWRIELPLAWTGILSALVLTFAHTLGEFGVVLMMGGNIPGQTRTLSIAIYDRVQMFDLDSAGVMSALLLCLSVVAISVVYMLGYRSRRNHA
jgi:molybdate transport system permease protein